MIMNRIASITIAAAIALVMCKSFGDTTNITFRVVVDVVSGGVTNSTTVSTRLDGSTQRDVDRLAGLQWAYAANPGTNTIGTWCRTMVTDAVDSIRRAKLQADNAALAAQIQQLLTSQQDLLSAQDLSNLRTIGAKAQ